MLTYKRRAAVLALAASCYHTSYWNKTGELRGHPAHASTHPVGVFTDTTFDEHALRLSVMHRAVCRPTLEGDRLEQRERGRAHLTHTSLRIGGGFLLAAGGFGGALVALSDTSSTTTVGTPRTPIFASDTRTALIVGGLGALAIGTIDLIYAFTHDHKDVTRWAPIDGSPSYVFTSTDTVYCATPPEPVENVRLHILVGFDRLERPFEWDVFTGSDGGATFDLDLEAAAGYCGTATVRASVGDTAWHAEVSGQRKPLDQIVDAPARVLAAECHELERQACRRERQANPPSPACTDQCASDVDATRCINGMRACSALAGDDDDDREVCHQHFIACLDEEGVDEGTLNACALDCQAALAVKECP